MKIFDVRFIGGTILTGLGTVATIAGFLSFLPPTSNILLGVLLVTIGLPTAIFGYRFAKNVYPDPAKTRAETLRKAKSLDSKKL
ncbi:MAG TPA: hypothetical protein VFZ48_00345 [Candidatus Saccharimonadales bacterium]